jgi:hypothetical protein
MLKEGRWVVRRDLSSTNAEGAVNCQAQREKDIGAQIE